MRAPTPVTTRTITIESASSWRAASSRRSPTGIQRKSVWMNGWCASSPDAPRIATKIATATANAAMSTPGPMMLTHAANLWRAGRGGRGGGGGGCGAGVGGGPPRRVVPGGRHAGRIRRPDLRRRDHRQDAVDQESEERERQHDPEEARGGVGERMGGEGHGALHRQPRSRLMFSRFTVFLCRKIAMMIARPTAASAAATVITKITNTWPVAP